MPEEPRLDEQMMSQVVQLGLATQLDEADGIHVEVHTDLLKAVQGQADSLSVSGQGVVVQDVRVEEMELQTDHVDINPLSMLLGKLELNHPLDAKSRMVLTEADLNRAMNNDSLLCRIPPLRLEVAGKPVTIVLQTPVQMRLPGNGKIEMDATVLLQEPDQTQRLCFSCALYPRTEECPLLLEEFRCDCGGAVTLDLTLALMHKFKELLELPNLYFEGTVFRIPKLEVEAGKLNIEVEARMYEAPFA